MKEICRTNDLVRLSWMQAMLGDGGIESVVLDAHTSAFYAGALMERRLMVSDDDIMQAKRVLKQAEAQISES